MSFLFRSLLLIMLCALSVWVFVSLTSSYSESDSSVSLRLPKTSVQIEQPPPIATITKKKIAYAITVTKDGHFLDGALVLGYSALKVHDKAKGFNSEYEAELVAFVTPSVVHARPVLQTYGWKVIEKRLPVELDDIENKDYAEKMRNSGCCGADEFLKLWAYTLTEYHRVVHLDMDSVVFGNMVINACANRLHPASFTSLHLT